MHTSRHFEGGSTVHDFISHWEIVASRASRREIIKELDEGFEQNVNACAFSILQDTRSFSKEGGYNWDRMNIYEQQADKLKQIYQNLLGLTNEDLKFKVNEFLALSTLIKCSRASQKLQKITANELEGVDSTQMTSLFSVFQEAVGLMVSVFPNQDSAVYPEIREILKEANLKSILDSIKGTKEAVKAITGSYLSLLELPEELRSHPAFHIQAFFQAIEQLAQKLADLDTSFTPERFRNEFSNFLRFYAKEILSKKNLKEGSFILRKSSIPDLYSSEGILKYITISLSRIDCKKEIKHSLFYYDTEKKEWINVKPPISISELDKVGPADRYKTLHTKLNSTSYRFPVSVPNSAQIEEWVSDYDLEP